MFNKPHANRRECSVSVQKLTLSLVVTFLTLAPMSPSWSQAGRIEPVGVLSLPPALRAAHPNAFDDANGVPRTYQGVAEPVVVDAPAEAGETLDRYAERLLEQRLRAPEDSPTVEEPQPVNEAPRHVGTLGPANLDLIYIAGTAARSQAYVRIDKRYAKLMRVGEYVAGWRLKGIGVDYVDIVKDAEQARLYLFSSRFEIKDLNAGRSGVY